MTSSPLGPNASALRLGRDSLAIRFTGMPEGIEIHEYSRTTTGYRYSSAISLGPTLHRQVAVDFDSSLHVVRSRSSTRLGSQRGESDVSYSGQHARGSVVPLQAASAGRVSVNTVLPRGAFDDLALYAMLLSQRWTPGQVDTSCR